jgi:hypothetical protein
MSKRQNPSAVVVCDDAVSGSESDKDVADELRVSMEGMPTESFHCPNATFCAQLTMLVAFDKRIAEVESEHDLELSAEFRRIEECRKKNLEVAKTHFQCRLKSIQACFLPKCDTKRSTHRSFFNLVSRASTSLMFARQIMKRMRQKLPPRTALSRL